MKRITTPAVRIEQDGKTLFLTRFTVAELTSPGFYRVEELVAGKDVGYQRELDERRARRFADYIEEVGERAFLPTSILLATSDSLDYDIDRGEITFEIGSNASQPRFFMVDGQHRAAGLEKIASRLDHQWVRDFSVPAIVATELDDIEQMVQFLVVNSTQKKVADDIAQQILAQFTRESGVADMPDLPKLIRDRIEDGTDAQALYLVERLNESEQSPWRGKIQMANETKNARTTAKQSMLVKSLKSHVLKLSHPIALEMDKEKRARMLENYWRAIARECLGPNPDAESEIGPLFKTMGVDVFHESSMAVFRHLSTNGLDRTERAIRECLKEAYEYIPDEFAGIFQPVLWKRGGVASNMNKSLARKYANALSEAVGRIGDNQDIQV